jgi:hypothetical protein
MRAREIGYGWGNTKVNRTQILEKMEGFYRKEFLIKVDAAYRLGKLSDWFKMLSVSGGAEIPIGRHLLFAYFFVSRCRPISSQYSHDCEF